MKDFDDVSTALTVSVESITRIDPPAGTAADGTATTIDFDGNGEISNATEALIDIYGKALPGWVQYTVRVDDATTYVPKGGAGSSALTASAVVKYASFALTQPTISAGMADVGDLSQTSRQFAWVWTGDDLEMYRLDVAIDPDSASDDVEWTVWVNNLITGSTSDNYDPNGNWLGYVTEYVADGSAVSEGGLEYNIDSNGTLTLTSSGAVSEGPWLVGILASEIGVPDNADGARILVSSALVASSTFTSIDDVSSTTFDNLSAATIPAAVNFTINSTTKRSQWVGGINPTYQETQIAGTHWRSEMAGPVDNTVAAVPLEIVDLATDTDLPPAAAVAIPQIASGMAIKASLDAAVAPIVARGQVGSPAGNQADGFRLQSYAFSGIEVGDVITFSLDVATDAADATSLPNYQMFLSSGFGATIYGHDIRVVKELANMAQTGNFFGSGTIPRVNLPLASEGWHRLSVNYTPGFSRQWLDVTAPFGTFDSADLAALTTVTEGIEANWDGADEQAAVFAGLQMRSTPNATQTVNVWLDNMVVYRSAFELDLALGAQSLTAPLTGNAQLDNLVNAGGITEQASDLDGSLESLAGVSEAQLSAAGITLGLGGGNAPTFDVTGKTQIDGDSTDGGTIVTLGSKDHTRNGGSSKSLNVTLTGDDGADTINGALDKYRQGIATTIVGAGGSGYYAFECYVAKDGGNLVDTFRVPSVRVILSEALPNAYGAGTGVIFTGGGLPDDVDDVADLPYNWARAVASMYIPDAVAIQGRLYVMDDYVTDVNNFSVPIYFDDLALYQIEDSAMYFDADLFDTL